MKCFYQGHNIYTQSVVKPLTLKTFGLKELCLSCLINAKQYFSIMMCDLAVAWGILDICITIAVRNVQDISHFNIEFGIFVDELAQQRY